MNKEKNQRIAVVGASAICPGSENGQIFWHNIVNGKDFITEIPPSHWLIEDYYAPDSQKQCKTYCKKGAFLSEIPFDPVEFGMPPKIVSSTDTVQLLSLIAAKNVLNDTFSLQSGKLNRQKISVILGIAAGIELVGEMNSKIQKPVWIKAMREHGIGESKVQAVCDNIENSYLEWTEDTFPGLLGNVVAGRISNRFDLGGINCTVDAACASSMSALTMAVHELQHGYSDMVITGGADALNSIFMFMCFSKTPALSPTNDCRPFSDNADGTILGEGIAMFSLRRLEDAERDKDKIYAIINAIGTSSDGKSKSIYAPSAKGQALAIKRAYEKIDYNPMEVELIEAHGTGTNAGDIAEFSGIQRVFESKKSKKQFCALGSIKSQIGHAKSASGAMGLFKAIMALHNKILPPTIKVNKPNSKFKIEDSPFYLNTVARPWIHDLASTRKASVNSYGFGGSNFHVALEEYKGSNAALRFYNPSVELIMIGSEDVADMDKQIQALFDNCDKMELSAIAKKSQESFQTKSKMRIAILAGDHKEIKNKFQEAQKKIHASPNKNFSFFGRMHYEFGTLMEKKIAFLFSAQGSQYINMGADIVMQFDEAREPWDMTAGLKLDKFLKLNEVVFPIPVFSEEERKKQQEILANLLWVQPAIGAMSLSHLALMNKIMLKPDCVAGHSYGEIPALYAAGVIQSPEEVLYISRRRGELIQKESTFGKGGMTAVFSSISEIEKNIKKWNLKVSIANINSPQQIVFSGKIKDIEEAERQFDKNLIKYRRLSVPTAYHSDLISPAAKPFYNYLKALKFSSPKIPVYSNTSGKLYPEDPEKIRKILAWQLAKQVLFKNEIESMYNDGVKIFVELGSGTVLSHLVKECLPLQDHLAISLDEGGKENGLKAFWNALGRLAIAGVSVDFSALWENFSVNEKIINKSLLSPTTVMIKGCNYGTLYPPKDGALGIPKPNYEPIKEKLQPENRKNYEGEMKLKNTNQNIVPIQEPINNLWLSAFSEVQKNTLEAHKSFQNTLTESHKAFLKASEAAFRQFGNRSELHQEKVLSDMSVTNTSESIKLQTPEIHSMLQPSSSIIMETEKAIESTENIEIDFKQILLKIVSDKTGYPAAMLEMDVKLEADLGIDSIKRIEILSSLQEEIPELKNIDTKGMAELNTLGEILSFATDSIRDNKQPMLQPSSSIIMETEKAIESTKNIEIDFKQILLKIVSDKTGYPAAMLEMDVKLEADLGIDSIKRIEILSSLQEEIPELKNIDTKGMAELNTLGEILSFATDSIRDNKQFAVEYDNKKESSAIYRYFVKKNLAPSTGVAFAGLKSVDLIYIIKDNRGVASLLAKKINISGIKTKIVTVLPDSADSVIFLKGLDTFSGNPVKSAIDLNKKAFEAARKCGGQLFAKGGLFVAVFDTNDEEREWSAGIGALAKTAAIEWPKAAVKSINIECKGHKPEMIAKYLFNELISGGPETEIFLNGKGDRFCYKIETLEIQTGGKKLQDGDSVVISGGGRGVTAASLLALTDGVKLNIAILGRTPLTDEPEFAKECENDAQLKKIILRNNKKIKPIELNKEAKAIFTVREIRNNLSELQKRGATVKYYSVDITNLKDVTIAINEIKKEWGNISAIIHGAGTLADKYIHTKTDEQFEKVFRTKVIGFYNLLSATSEDELTHICCFSSIAAVTGNAGQVDYSMANEVLNKICTSEYIRRNGICSVKSINWGPWEGGMVSPELKDYFKSLGIALIPIKEGADAFVQEFETSNTENVEVIIGGRFKDWRERAGINNKVKISELWIHESNYSFLYSHSIKNVPVVPVMMANEWCIKVAGALFPEKEALISMDMKVLKGIILNNFQKQGDWFKIICKEEENGEFLNFIIASMTGIKHYSIRIQLSEKEDNPPFCYIPDTTGHNPWNLKPKIIYKDKLFHGKDFEVIKRLEGISDKGCVGILESNGSLNGNETACKWNVAVLDGGLQLASLWVKNEFNKDSLPIGFKTLNLYKHKLYNEQIRCELRLNSRKNFETRWDINYINFKNELCAKMEDLVLQTGLDANLYKTQED